MFYPPKVFKDLQIKGEFGTAPGGAVAWVALELTPNDLHDPLATHGTEQPLIFDAMALQYQNYYVYQCEMAVTLINKTGDDIVLYSGVHRDNDILTTGDGRLAFKGVSKRLHLSRDSGEKNKVTWHKTVRCKNWLETDQRYSTPVANSPTHPLHYYVLIETLDGNNFVASEFIYAFLKMNFSVMFSTRKELINES